MNPWVGNLSFLFSVIASVCIRIPHDKRSQATKISEDRKGTLEKILMGLVMIGMVVLPLLSFTPLLDFAAYSLTPLNVAVGIIAMLLSLWLFHRSHADLGRNWSATLQIREDHALVTGGIYESIRHPMYTSIFLLAIGQLFLLPNWIAGPGLLVAFSAMFFTRLHTEERMMLDKFGYKYEDYRSSTKRIITGVWKYIAVKVKTLVRVEK